MKKALPILLVVLLAGAIIWYVVKQSAGAGGSGSKQAAGGSGGFGINPNTVQSPVTNTTGGAFGSLLGNKSFVNGLGSLATGLGGALGNLFSGDDSGDDTTTTDITGDGEGTDTEMQNGYSDTSTIDQLDNADNSTPLTGTGSVTPDDVFDINDYSMGD